MLRTQLEQLPFAALRELDKEGHSVSPFRRRPSRRYLAVALTLAAVLHPQGYAQTTDTIVRLAGAPRHPGVAMVTEDLTIGVREGSTEYTFNGVVDVAIGQGGEILVLDGLPTGGRATIRLYDPKGRFRRTIGRLGRGPGEYVSAWGVTFLRDGRIALYDRLGARINIYTAEGDYSDTWLIPVYRDGAPLFNEIRSLPEGGIAISIKMSVPPGDPAGGDAVDAIVRVDSNGTVIDTLRVPPLPDIHQIVTVRRARGTSTFHVAYSPRSFWRWSPLGYVVTGVSKRYSIDLLLPRSHDGEADKLPYWRRGDAVLSIRRDVAPVVVSSEERADQDDFLRERTQRSSGRLEGRIPRTPRIKPYFGGLFVGDDGRIWVSVHTVSTRYMPSRRETESTPHLGWREVPQMDVYEPDGVYIGRVRMPYDFYPLTFRGDRIWGVIVDAVGVDYIKCYAVVWNEPGDSL